MSLLGILVVTLMSIACIGLFIHSVRVGASNHHDGDPGNETI